MEDEPGKTCGSFVKQTLPKFGKHFIIIGFIGGVIATAIECNERYTGIAGFVYGIIPVTFIYLYAVAVKYHGIDNADDLSKTTFIGGFLWLLYVCFVLIVSVTISKKLCSDSSASCKTKKSCLNLLVPLGVIALLTLFVVICMKKFNPSLLWYETDTSESGMSHTDFSMTH